MRTYRSFKSASKARQQMGKRYKGRFVVKKDRYSNYYVKRSRWR